MSYVKEILELVRDAAMESRERNFLVLLNKRDKVEFDDEVSVRAKFPCDSAGLAMTTDECVINTSFATVRVLGDPFVPIGHIWLTRDVSPV